MALQTVGIFLTGVLHYKCCQADTKYGIIVDIIRHNYFIKEEQT